MGARLAAVLTLALGAPALAQNADDNVVTQADDAFGKAVGQERVGIYSPSDVRGFSPQDAGNVRLEGLYFDQQAFLTDRLVDGNSVRVGLSAQSYPFPAPTGIAEFTLRKPGDKRQISPFGGLTAYGGWFFQNDVKVPVTDRLGVHVGAGWYAEENNFGGSPRFLSLAATLRWRPRDGVEILPYFSRIAYSSDEAQPLLQPGGALLPPMVKRLVYYGQDWANNAGRNFNYGLIAKVARGAWTLESGVFRSVQEVDRSFAALFLGVQPDGRAREVVIANPKSKFAATSGELRLTRRFDEGPRRHSLVATLRAREQTRRYGGEAVIDLGDTVIGVQRPVPRPDFAFGAQSFDRIRQTSYGLMYGLQWRDIGELSAGLLKTDYRRDSRTPTGDLAPSIDAPWLPNATLALTFIPGIVIYGSFVRGLEESPRPPNNAVNRNDALPATRTRQVDAGVRWNITDKVKFVAGVFEVSKPFFDVDAAGRFRQVGAVTNRGLELSLAGSPVKGLTVLAGSVFLDPTVSGEEVAAGRIGRRPVAAILRNSVISADYRFPGSGFSLDAVVESTGRRVANQANTLSIPPRAVLSLGGRYRFTLGTTALTVRAQVGNVLNNYGFGVGGGGLIVTNLPRRFILNIAADI